MSICNYKKIKIEGEWITKQIKNIKKRKIDWQIQKVNINTLEQLIKKGLNNGTFKIANDRRV